jgi:predicted nucleic acid-binding protein
MNILVDSSVWVNHFKYKNHRLIELLSIDMAISHPMIILELACGTPPAPRLQTIRDIECLRQANQASLAEVMALIEREQLYGLGCGLVDLSLLAAAMLTPDTFLWTLDKQLHQLAKRFEVGYQAPSLI